MDIHTWGDIHAEVYSLTSSLVSLAVKNYKTFYTVKFVNFLLYNFELLVLRKVSPTLNYENINPCFLEENIDKRFKKLFSK